MTHAALKDQLATLESFLETGPVQIIDGKQYVMVPSDELSAALSAMEGEAVAWIHSEDLREIHEGIERKDAPAFASPDDVEPEYRDGMVPLYTAPPPQQAAERAQDGVTENEFLAIGQAFTEVLGDPAVTWADRPVKEFAQAIAFRAGSALATQPQQAGGDDYERDEVLALLAELARALPPISVEQSATQHMIQKNRREQALQRIGDFILHKAKKPTHPQPEAGGGVTDAMVERAAFALSGVNKNQWEYDALLRKRHIAAARTALTAAFPPPPPAEASMATKWTIKHSPWLRFYRCPACGAHDEKASLHDPTGPCPKCGDDHLAFPIGRWRIEMPENTLWQDLRFVIQEDVWTAEFKEPAHA